jgi:predicted transposase/invertase (TIGR01784 family)
MDFGAGARIARLEPETPSERSSEGWHEVTLVINYLLQAGDPADHAALKELTARLGPKAEEIYMTIAEQIRQEAAVKARKEGQKAGRKAGQKEGRKEGRKDTQLEVAAKALAKGLSVSEVAELTGLPVDEVRALAH